MPARSSALSCAVLVLLAVASPAPAAAITKGDFPPGFVFGTGSSAYQVRTSVAQATPPDHSSPFVSGIPPLSRQTRPLNDS
jgi:hypothetical protein